MDRFRSFVMAILVIAISACGHSPDGPTPVVTTTPTPTVTPTPTPGNPVMLRLTDAWTGATVVGPTITAAGAAVPVNSEGKASFNGLTIGQVVTVSVPNGGYRDHKTLYCGGSDITLLPHIPGDPGDALMELMTYSYPQDAPANTPRQIFRPKSVGLMLSPEIAGDDASRIQVENAAREATEATGIPVRVGVPGEWTYAVRVNANLLPATAGGITTPGPAVDSYIEFRSLQQIRVNYAVALHEIIHSTGVTGHNPYPGLMNGTTGAASLTDQEKMALKLRLTRPNSALFTGDDDSMIPCSAR